MGIKVPSFVHNLIVGGGCGTSHSPNAEGEISCERCEPLIAQHTFVDPNPAASAPEPEQPSPVAEAAAAPAPESAAPAEEAKAARKAPVNAQITDSKE